MIITRKREGLKTTTYKATRPTCLRQPFTVWKRRASRDDFIAASDFESALMDREWSKADCMRHATLVQWIRKTGQQARAAIPRPVAA